MNDSWWHHKSIYENMKRASLLSACIRRWWTVAVARNRFNKIRAKRMKRWGIEGERERTRTKSMLQSISQKNPKALPIFTSSNFFIVCVCLCFLVRHLPISFRCNINKITNVYSKFILFVCSFIYLFVYYLVIILTWIIVSGTCM